jgi:hypothetical protein
VLRVARENWGSARRQKEIFGQVVARGRGATSHPRGEVPNYWVSERQDVEFKRLGLEFPGLFGRRLQPIDCQNLFCEISKYARVAHPDIGGVANRTRIKQSYRQNTLSMPKLTFPERWGIHANEEIGVRTTQQLDALQPTLF